MNNRRRGHAFERWCVNALKNLKFKYYSGFGNCATSRAVSKLLDDCKIDIAASGLLIEDIPLLIQCKYGYDNRRPKADIIFSEMDYELKKHFPENHRIHKVPKILLHKMLGGKKENFIMSFMYEDGIHLLKDALEFRAIKDTL